MRSVGVIALLGLGLAACTNFAAIDRGVCGNGIIEAGEDCDSPSPDCVACAVRCGSAADCPTTDYTCGVDGFCHAPGGALAAPSAATTFEVDDLRITDIDHDGIGDVLGVSKTALGVEFGGAAGVLSSGGTFVTPSQTGPAAFGDLDGDGSLDVAIVTPDGIASYTSPYGLPSEVAVSSPVLDDAGAPVDILALVHVSDTSSLGFVNDGAGNLVFRYLDLATPANDALALPCGSRGMVPTAGFTPAMVDTYLATADGDLPTDMVIAFTISGKLCATALHVDADGSATFTDITPTPVPTMTSRPVLAALDGATVDCPGIVDGDGGPTGLKYWRSQSTAAHCGLATPAISLPMIPDAPASSAVIGRVSLEPLVPFNAVPDALVTTEGVFQFTPASTGPVTPAVFTSLYTSDRKLAMVVPGIETTNELQGAILVADGEADLDILQHDIEDNAGFELLRLPTASQPTSVTVGDYDADGNLDIAYTETIGDHDRVMIAYGQLGGPPLTPVQVATFSHVVGVDRIEVTDSADQLGIAQDLAVVGGAGGSALPEVTVLHGSPERTMLSFFDPRSTAAKKTALFGAVAIGDFTAGAGTYKDFVGLAPTNASALGSGVAAVRAWIVTGTADGPTGSDSDGVEIDGVSDCGTDDTGGVCVDTAQFLSWSVGSDHDVVLGVDRRAKPNAGVVDPLTITADKLATTAAPALTANVPMGATIQSMYAADVDGDGTPDLVATFAASTVGSAGALLVCQVTAGIPTSCTDITPAIVAADATITDCVDAAPGQFQLRDPTTAPTPNVELVAACRDAAGNTSLFGVVDGPGGFTATTLTSGLTSVLAIRIGDVNGDGVDDVVALVGDAGSKSLVVYAQCTSRTLATCGAVSP